ncbi:GNAT family N-acetyltransferase [Streptacidiphilus sp. PAMC 29251]
MSPTRLRSRPRTLRAANTGTGLRTVQLIRDAKGFDALAADWDGLVDRCSSATPFQSHAWLSSWWHSYGKPGRLRLLTVRQDGVLVAAAPLMLRRLPAPQLVPIGGGLSDFLDVLLDDDLAEQIAPVLARALAERLRLTRPWAVLDLRELRPDAAAHRLAAHWPGAVLRFPDSLCQHLPGVPMDEVLARLPGRTAQRSRAKLRKLDSAGVETSLVPAEGVPQALAELLALHELQWRGRGVTPSTCARASPSTSPVRWPAWSRPTAPWSAGTASAVSWWPAT